MIFLIEFLALLEIAWDWHLITVKKRSPNYTGSNILRVVIGIIVVLIWYFFVPNVSKLQIYYSPVMIFFNFWFTFDYGLNKARKKPLRYLGSRGLDLWQRNHGGLVFWFNTKLILAVLSIIVYYML